MLAYITAHTVSYEELDTKGHGIVQLSRRITSEDFTGLLRFIYPKYVDSQKLLQLLIEY